MIEMSALPSIAQLFGAVAPQGDMGEEAPTSAQFAQLLSLRLGISPADPQTPEAKALPRQAKQNAASGKSSGNAGGSTLPDLPQPLPDTATEQTTKQETQAQPALAVMPPESAVAAFQFPMPELPTAAIAILAPLPPTDAAPSLPVANAGETPAPPAAKAMAAKPGEIALPVPDYRVEASEPATPAAGQTPPSAARLVSPAQPAPAPQAAPAPLLAPQLAKPANQPLVFVPPFPATALPGQSRSFAPLRLIPLKTVAGEASIQRIPGEPLAADETDVPAEPSKFAPPPSPAIQLAASLRQLLSRLGAKPTESASAAPQVAPAEPAALDGPMPAQAPSGTNPPAPSNPEAAIAQPALSVPAATPAAPSTNPVAPRDFVQLIDRLSEAREAFRSAQPAQPVEAAIAHAEFGQVQLRFVQDGGALSVSLSSPDPEFSRAVQAAAPAGQQGLAQDNTAAPQRHDAPGQQGGGAGSGQPQSQQRGQAEAQQASEQRDRRAPQAQQSGEAKPPRRNGIFA